MTEVWLNYYWTMYTFSFWQHASFNVQRRPSNSTNTEVEFDNNQWTNITYVQATFVVRCHWHVNQQLNLLRFDWIYYYCSQHRLKYEIWMCATQWEPKGQMYTVQYYSNSNQTWQSVVDRSLFFFIVSVTVILRLM